MLAVLTTLVALSVAETAPAPASSAPVVRVEQLDGTQTTGPLASIDAASLTLRSKAGPIRVPREQLLLVEVEPTESAAPTRGDAPVRVVLWDGSQLRGQAVYTKDRLLTLEVGPEDRLELPVESVAGVLLAPLEPNDLAAWSEEVLTDRRSDELLVRNKDRRFRLEGAFGDLTEEGLDFFFEGDSLAVKPDRLLSLLYAGSAASGEPVAAISDVRGNEWVAAEVAWDDQGLRLRTGGGLERRLGPADVRTIDFGLGRLVYLSDLEPARVETAMPVYPDPLPELAAWWQPARDETASGQPLRLRGQRYAHGLSLHATATIDFALAREYRELRGVAGIDDAAGSRGDALLRILGDGRELFTARVKAGDEPVAFGVPVVDVDRLRVEVLPAAGLHFGDQVDLVDVRLVK